MHRRLRGALHRGRHQLTSRPPASVVAATAARCPAAPRCGTGDRHPLKEHHRGRDTPLLELRGIDKSFGPVQVLRDVAFTVHPGEVTALVGDNGAGKSTLVKCISGIYPTDAGEYLFDGRPVHVHSPRDAAALGIEIVYQDLALCDNLDIVQNMFLGREKAQRHRARRADHGADGRARPWPASPCGPSSRCASTSSSLSGGQRQTVAIAKAVLWNSKLVILDEPTAALGVAQTAQVLELVRRLADNGLAVVLISHNMNDVFAVSDRIAALYLGRMVAQVKTTDVTHAQVVELITVRPQRQPRPAARTQRLRNATATHGSRAMTTTTTTAASVNGRHAGTLGGHLHDYWRRVRGGDMGALPAVLGLIVLCAVFSASPGRLLHRRSTSPTCSPRAPQVIVIAMGLVFVLLLGEIDLSAGFASGVCARRPGRSCSPTTACPGTSPSSPPSPPAW